MTSVTKQLAAALSDALTQGSIAEGIRERGRLALDAYKESAEAKRERVDQLLQQVSANANQLDADLQELLAVRSLLSDHEEVALIGARSAIAEAADTLNQLIEGEPS